MKTFKNICYLLLIGIIVFIFGYLIFVFSIFNVKNNVILSDLINTVYYSKDEKSYFYLSSEDMASLSVNDASYFIEDINFDKGILMLLSDEGDVFKLATFNKNLIYLSDYNIYLHNSGSLAI